MQASEIDPRGPLFLSYRQSDGTDVAAELSEMLRAAGLPVWRDATDMPPGDTTRNLEDAMHSGLSGAVLVVTPEVGDSRVVREVELPIILELAERVGFVFAIATTLRKDDGSVDYGSSDALLRRRDGELSQRIQHPVAGSEDLHRLAEDLLGQRIRAIAPAARASGELNLHVQSRLPARAWDERGTDLILRLPPPTAGSLPSNSAIELFGRMLPILARTIPLAGDIPILITGGFHLSLGVALGMALPTTVIPVVTILDRQEQRWSLTSEPLADRMTRTESNIVGTDGAELVVVDLLAEPSARAAQQLATADNGFRAVHRIDYRDDRIDSSLANQLAREIAREIRTISGAAGNSEVHLAYRGPLALAILLGTLLNTVTIIAYEWDNPPGGGPIYVPTFRLRSGIANAPIVDVFTRS